MIKELLEGKKVRDVAVESTNDNPEIEEVWDYLIDYSIATEEELKLVTSINGYSVETLNQVIYARTAYHSLDQLKDSE